MIFQMGMTSWHALHHTAILRKKSLGANITREIANFEHPAVENYLHAGFVMIKSVIIQWTGRFASFGLLASYNYMLFIILHLWLFAGRQPLK